MAKFLHTSPVVETHVNVIKKLATYLAALPRDAQQPFVIVVVFVYDLSLLAGCLCKFVEPFTNNNHLLQQLVPHVHTYNPVPTQSDKGWNTT